MKRTIDVIAIFVSLPLTLPLAIGVLLAVTLTSRGSAIYWSKRVGRHEQIFLMPKFRTMSVDTPAVATHLLENPAQWLTPIGGFLRKSSLDEIPQLWSVLVGHMTLVGPRPALFNQDDLVRLRREAGVNALVPGVTGWAQVNGRDDLPIPEKVAFDRAYVERRSLMLDLQILLMTIINVVRPRGVSH